MLDIANQVPYEAAADAACAFTFLRIEDGNADYSSPGSFYFVTTGTATKDAAGQYINSTGRMYRLTIDPKSPTSSASLDLVIETDREPDSRKVINPDNIDVSPNGLVIIQEDATAEGTIEMTRLGREGSMWAYNIRTKGLERIAELD